MVFVALLVLPGLLSAQQVTLSGTVHDETTGELLVGATVSDPTDQYGVITNQYGFFSLTLPPQIDTLEVSYVGYETLVLTKLGTQHSPLDIRLAPQQRLDELVVKGKIRREVAGQFVLPVSRIKSIPALLGEVDVLKALSLTPGVMTGGEGTAGLFVRGGTPDQNLILLDEAPVYNVTHLGGFFSVFNPNSLKSVSLYKGPFPARFGGRLSSVIDLTMKDGNKKKLAGQVGIGLLSQNLTVEGPIIKNKASFIVSGRISTLGVSRLFRPRQSKAGYGDFPSYGFYDLNAKFNYKLSATDQFYVSLYKGDDNFKVTEWSNTNGQREEIGTGIAWGNTTATARYSKILSDKLFARAVLIYSRYNSGYNTNYSQYNPTEDRLDEFYSNTNSHVRDYGFKLQFDHFPNSFLSLKYGTDVTVHTFSPFRLRTNYELAGGVPPVTDIVGTQVDGFVESSTTFRRFRADVGLRGSLYRVQGRTFAYPEPRLGLNWKGPKHWSVKAGYSVMNQYVHLLSNNGLGLNFDAWVPSTAKVPPANAQQWSLGLYKEFPKPGLDLSVELYRKSLKRIIDYPDGIGFSGLAADGWDDTVEKGGIGRIRGLEVMLRRETGRLNGWISYTLSKSERQFANIDEARWYPMRYDRRHNLAVTGNLKIGKKWSLSSTFVYQTGHAVTLPVGATSGRFASETQLLYGDRNNGRMPAYHRLDLGASKELVTRRGRKAQLNFGLYNAYNRANPLYFDFKTVVNPANGVPLRIETKQRSLIPVLPYISYTLNF